MRNKRFKAGLVILMVAALAVTAAAVGAQNGPGGMPGGPGGPGGMWHHDFGGPGDGFGGRGMGRGFGLRGELLTILAEQLGIEESELRIELQSGKTVAALAEEHGVSTDAIIEAVIAAQQEALDTAVSEGWLTQEQADAHIELLRANIDAMLDDSFGGGWRARAGGLLDILTEQLGIDAATLVTEIQDGKTIAELAEESGVSTDAIVDAMVAARQEVLTAAVTDGRLTQEQADARLELVRANITAMLDQPLNLRGFGGRHGFGRGMHNFLEVPGMDAPANPDVSPEATAEANA